jgi:hypothetical protein
VTNARVDDAVGFASRLAKVRGLRARTNDEQLLAVMLIAGFAFVIVPLIAFAGAAKSRSPLRVGKPGVSAVTRGTSATTAGPTPSPPFEIPRARQAFGVPAPAQMVEQQLHRLFTSVLSPSEVSTNLPLTPQPSGGAAAHEAGGGSRTTTASAGEHRVDTRTTSAVSTTTSTHPLLMLPVPLPLP